MIECKNCNKKNSEDSNFCFKCGAKLRKICNCCIKKLFRVKNKQLKFRRWEDMNKDFNFIEIEENNGIGKIKIDGVNLKKISNYGIKRDTDSVNLTLTISVPTQNFKTNSIQ